MPKKTIYLRTPPDCIFVPLIEWSIIESNLSPEDRAKYDQEGYPHVKLRNGEIYKYLPIEINGIKYRMLPGKRPVKE